MPPPPKPGGRRERIRNQDPSIEPNKRPNWDSLNVGNRQYSYKRHNEWRVNHGLQPLPFPEDAQTGYKRTEPGTSTLTPVDAEADEDDIISNLDSIDKAIAQAEKAAAGDQGPSTSKRPADSSDSVIEPPPKMPRSHTTGTTATTSPMETDAVTADATGTTFPGTGARNQSLGGGSSMPEVTQVPRPRTNDSYGYLKFRKQHKFYTFAIGSKTIKQEIAASGTTPAYTLYLRPTGLAEVPVHKLPFYLNKSEFDLLPEGSEVINCSITVGQRNPVLNFFTNQSVANNATLNQNKNTIVAKGINKTGYGINVWPKKSEPGNDMLVTEVGRPIYYENDAPNYYGMVKEYYGVDQGVDFDKYPAHHQFGNFTLLYNYFAVTTTDKYKGGWPLYNAKIQELNGTISTDTIVAKYSYSPVVGYIKKPLNYIPTQAAINDFFSHSTYKSGFESMQADHINGNLSYIEGLVRQQLTDDLFDYEKQDIEKSQWLSRGTGGTIPAVIQDSLHVGAKPIPAAFMGNLTQFEDIQKYLVSTSVYFDITAEIEIRYRLHTDRPYATMNNVAAGEEMFSTANITGNIPDYSAPVYAALYGKTNVLPENTPVPPPLVRK